MRRFVFTLVACATLSGLVVALRQYYSLETALAISGVIGTAGTLAALVSEKSPARRPRFHLSDAFLRVKYDAEDGYYFEAFLINEGDRPDVLRRVEYQLYHDPLGFIDSLLVLGGSEVAANKGHVLPIECRPGVLYKVEGTGTIPIRFPFCDPRGEGYVLRCNFIFGAAKPMTVRVTKTGLSKSSAIRHALRETGLRIATRNKNPFDHAA